MAINVSQQEVSSSLKYNQVLAGAPIPPRRKLDVDKDGHLRTFKRLLVSKDITLEIYMRNILEIYYFPALEQKKDNNSDTSYDDLNEE
jgi:hypothetical protein